MVTARLSGSKIGNKLKTPRLAPFGAKKEFYSSDRLLGSASIAKLDQPENLPR